jgi:hypothetical protein
MWAKITKEGFKSMISFRNAVEQRTALHILANGLNMTNPNEYNKWILDTLRGALSRHDDELTRRTYFDFLKLLWVKASSTSEYIGVLELKVVEQDMLIAFGDSSALIRQVTRFSLISASYDAHDVPPPHLHERSALALPLAPCPASA